MFVSRVDVFMLIVLHLPGWRTDLEDHQEENSSTDLVEVVSWIREACNLPLAPSGPGKIRDFQAGLDSNDQPSSSYCLPISDASTDILAYIDDSISSSSSSMHYK